MEVASTSETSINFYQTTRCNIPEEVFVKSNSLIQPFTHLYTHPLTVRFEPGTFRKRSSCWRGRYTNAGKARLFRGERVSVRNLAKSAVVTEVIRDL
jgi:hypothetical protein